jgi:hypothetical protein
MIKIDRASKMGAPTASRVALAALMTLACASVGVMGACSTYYSITWFYGDAGEEWLRLERPFA